MSRRGGRRQRTPRRRSTHISAQVRHKCGTSAAQVRHKCGTSAAQVRNKCGTSAAQVWNKCGASAEQVRGKCGAQFGSRAERRRMCGAASSGKNTPQKTQKHPQEEHKNTKKTKKTPFLSPCLPGCLRVLPVRIRCGTTAEPVRHRRGAGSVPVRIACGMGAGRVRSGCGTPAERRRNAGGTGAERRRNAGGSTTRRPLGAVRGAPAPPIEGTWFIIAFSRDRAPQNARSWGLGPPPSTCAHEVNHTANAARYVVGASSFPRHRLSSGFYPIFALSISAFTCAFWLRASVRAWAGQGRDRASDFFF